MHGMLSGPHPIDQALETHTCDVCGGPLNTAWWAISTPPHPNPAEAPRFHYACVGAATPSCVMQLTRLIETDRSHPFYGRQKAMRAVQPLTMSGQERARRARKTLTVALIVDESVDVDEVSARLGLKRFPRQSA